MLEAMKAAVLADPDDLLTLQVYADALLELGDPLGEVVRAAAHHPFPRVAHASEHFIAGKLASSLIDLTLERAVMTAVTLRRLTPRGFARITGRKEWHSVRSIHFERGKTAKTQVLPVNEVVGLLTHPVMSSLREVTGFDQAVLAELGTQPKRLPVEAVEGVTPVGPPREGVRATTVEVFVARRVVG